MSENISENPDAVIAKVDEPAAATSRLVTLAGLIGVLVCLLIYILRLDHVAGLFVDDAWYIMLAQALATGHGFTLINSPSPGILPIYPPGYPFLLSLLHRLYPHFPENVWLFKALSIAALLGVGVLVFRYFVQIRQTPHHFALGLVGVTLLCPPLVFLATSTVMSECVFTFNLMATILIIERGVRAAKSGANPLKYILIGATLAAFGFLLRTIAIAVIAAIVVYLFKERLNRQAWLFAALMVLLLTPWLIYTRTHAPTPEQRAEQGGHVTLRYGIQFWQKYASAPEMGTIGYSGLPERIWRNLQEIAGRDIGRIMATPIFEALIDPYKEAQNQKVKLGISHGRSWFFSFILSAVVLLGFIAVVKERITLAEVIVAFSLGITTLWPWETFRFILPLVAFITFYGLMGFGVLLRFYQSWRATTQRVAAWKLMSGLALVIIIINLAGHINYIVSRYSNSPMERPQWLQIFTEAETMLTWIKREVPRDSILTAANPPLVYLYTGNKTVSLDEPAKSWSNWNKVGVRYMVRASVYPDPHDPAEDKYKVVYRSRSGLNFRVIDLGDPNNRPAWGSANGK